MKNWVLFCHRLGSSLTEVFDVEVELLPSEMFSLVLHLSTMILQKSYQVAESLEL